MSVPGVAPFRALRFQIDRVGELGAVWAPPYDVIGPEQAAELRSRSAYNIVHVTNPAGDSAQRYAEAARTLRSWIDERALAREPRPAFYVHRHSFTSGASRQRRTGVWALLRLAALDEGVVLAHERTMKGPKADRLALMRACQAQLSPVFFICSDYDASVSDLLAELAAQRPAETAEFPAGERHEIRRVEKRRTLEVLANLMAGRKYLIADGHHRYETALAYRDELVAAGAPRGGSDAHHYVLAYIVPESDPGLVLLATHRTIGGDRLDWIAATLEAAGRFEITRLAESAVDAAVRALEDEAGRPSFVLATREPPASWLMRLRRPDALGAISSVAFHDVFLSGCVELAPEEQLERIRYLTNAAEALGAVRSGAAQAAALLAPPRVAQVREAAGAGRLPPKSTYFWPKVPTGVAIHVLDAEGGEE